MLNQDVSLPKLNKPFSLIVNPGIIMSEEEPPEYEEPEPQPPPPPPDYSGIISALLYAIQQLDSVTARLIEDADIAIEKVAVSIRTKAIEQLTKISLASTSAIDRIDDVIQDNVRSVSETIKAVNDSILIQADNTAQEVSETFNAIDYYIEDQSINTSRTTGEVALSVIDDITNLTGDIVGHIGILTDTIAGDVDELVSDVQSGIRTDINAVTDVVTDITTQALITSGEAVEQIKLLAGESLTELGELTKIMGVDVIPLLIGTVKELTNSWFMTTTNEARDDIIKAGDYFPEAQDMLVRLITDKITFKELFFGFDIIPSFFGIILAALELAASNVLMATQAASIANGVKIEKMLQTLWSGDPVRLFSFPETVSLTARGHISETEAKIEAAKDGYDPKHFDTALKGSYTPLSVEQAVNALHREEIDEIGFKNYMERQGYNENDSFVIRALGNLRPPVQDLISMSVRDVFTRSIVDEFELFSELPAEFVVEAGKNGLSKEWAEKYWGQHWRLPSANQGFEMFHRGFITDKQLDLLIKALDVSPFWRKPLKSIAYRPITRVDIRRMFKLGVMSKEEVTRRHLDLGYSPDDADKMTEFVVSLIDDTILEDDVDTRILTQTQIKQLFLQGTLSKEEAIDGLISTDYSSSAAWLLVGSWETGREIRDRTSLLRLVTNKAVREGLDITEIEIIISGLNLTADERIIMNREIELRSSEYPNIPSKTELKQMRQKNIINEHDWINTMHQHGYNLVWINRYKQLWGLNDG